MRDNYLFIPGALDTDSDPRAIEKGDVIEMLNAVSHHGKVIKPEGSEFVVNLSNSGYTIVAAKLYNRDIYYVAAHATNADIIGKYNLDTQNQTPIIVETWLNYSPTHKFDGLDVIRDELRGRTLIYVTDGINPPRVFCEELALADITRYDTAEKATVAKHVNGYVSFIGRYEDDLSENKLENKAFTFAFRLLYDTGEVGPISSFSEPCFTQHVSLVPPENEYKYLLNNFNTAYLSLVHYFPSSIENWAKQVEFFAKEISSQTIYKIGRVDTVSGDVKLTFKANGSYPAVPESEAQKLYDNVPHLANKQCIVDNRLFYGDYEDGYSNDVSADVSVEAYEKPGVVKVPPSVFSVNKLTWSNDVLGTIRKGDRVNFSFELTDGTDSESPFISLLATKEYATLFDLIIDTPTLYYQDDFFSRNINVSSDDIVVDFTPKNSGSGWTFTGGTANSGSIYHDKLSSSHSLKHGTAQTYAMRYHDINGRTGNLINLGTFNVPNIYISGSKSYGATININHTPPPWATGFKFLRKKINMSFESIVPETSAIYNNKVYIKLRDFDAQKISDTADRIELIGTLSHFTNSEFSVKILSVEAVDSTHPTLTPGRWISFVPPVLSDFSLAAVTAGTSLYAQSRFLVYTFDEIQEPFFQEIPGNFQASGGYHLTNGDKIGLIYENRSQTDFQSFRHTIILDGDVVLHEYQSSPSNHIANILYKLDATRSFGYLGRSGIEADEFDRQYRPTSVTYSKKYIVDSGYNGLSTFNLGDVNFKDYDRLFGPIKKLFVKDTDLMVFCENKVILQPYGKNIIKSATGEDVVTASDTVLGSHRTYEGEYGMSHPDSFAIWGNNSFWVDAKRGVVMRLALNGLYPISYHKMSDFWYHHLRDNQGLNYLGVFDPKYEEYLLYDGVSKVYHYSTSKNRWTRATEYVPSRFITDDIQVYAYRNTDGGRGMYKLYSDAVPKNNYFGIQKDAKIVFAANTGFSDIKTAHAVFIEGDEWDVELVNEAGELAKVDKTQFEEKEGFLYSAIYPIDSAATFDNPSSLAWGGIGRPLNVYDTAPTCHFLYDFVPDTLAIGDNVYINGGTLVGTVINIQKGPGTAVVNIGVYFNLPTTSDFLYYVKPTLIENGSIKGNYFIVTLTNQGADDKNIFAINLEIQKSNS